MFDVNILHLAQQGSFFKRWVGPISHRVTWLAKSLSGAFSQAIFHIFSSRLKQLVVSVRFGKIRHQNSKTKTNVHVKYDAAEIGGRKPKQNMFIEIASNLECKDGIWKIFSVGKVQVK